MLLRTTSVVSAFLTLFLWIPVYHVLDARVVGILEKARAGQGTRASIFSKEDCQNPCRGCCKVRSLQVLRFYRDPSIGPVRSLQPPQQQRCSTSASCFAFIAFPSETHT